MHVVVAILGSIITILILLNRLADAGIDLGGLNPFLWNRRRKWKNKYDGNPAFKLTDPMEATALLMVAVAKCDGDLTREQKSHILGIFENEFHLSRKDAQGLLIASTHLHGDGHEIRGKVKEVLATSYEKFTKDQAESAIHLVKRVASAESEQSDERAKLVAAIEGELAGKLSEKQKWA